MRREATARSGERFEPLLRAAHGHRSFASRRTFGAIVSAAGAAIVSWSCAIGTAESALDAPRDFGNVPSLLATPILLIPALLYAAIPVAVAGVVRSRRRPASASSALATVMFLIATHLFFSSAEWWKRRTHGHGFDLALSDLALVGGLVILIATGVAFTAFLLPVARWTSCYARGLDEDGRLVAWMGIWLSAASAIATVGLAGVGLPYLAIAGAGVALGAWPWLWGSARQRAVATWLERVRRGEVEGTRVRPAVPDERESLRDLPRLLASKPCTGVLEIDDGARDSVHPYRAPRRAPIPIALVPLGKP